LMKFTKGRQKAGRQGRDLKPDGRTCGIKETRGFVLYLLTSRAGDETVEGIWSLYSFCTPFETI